MIRARRWSFTAIQAAIYRYLRTHSRRVFDRRMPWALLPFLPDMQYSLSRPYRSIRVRCRNLNRVRVFESEEQTSWEASPRVRQESARRARPFNVTFAAGPTGPQSCEVQHSVDPFIDGRDRKNGIGSEAAGGSVSTYILFSCTWSC